MKTRGLAREPVLCWNGGAMICPLPPTFLAATEWQALVETHRQRAESWTLPCRDRRARGVPHPIDDFLFTYYSYSFSKLEIWHPAYGTAMEIADELPECFSKDPYRSEGGAVFQVAEVLGEKERKRLRWIRELLMATHGRTPNFACHGLHEWAMVYRGKEVRHEKTTPLRLLQAEIDALVESRPVVCSHFDAFRFFAPEAVPLNRLQPSFENRPAFEQPGCIHANMDLYKWASKAMPWIGSELLLACFEQAVELRDLDMRASPYDLSAWGRQPVRIETAEGRREYERQQRALAAKAAALRARLIHSLAFV